MDFQCLRFHVFGHGVDAFAAETIQMNRTQHEFDSPYRIDLPGESIQIDYSQLYYVVITVQPSASLMTVVVVSQN